MGANIAGLLPKVLYSGQMATTAETTVYTSVNGSQVQSWTLCNTSGSAVTVSIAVLQSGQAMGAGTHSIISGYSLAAGDTIDIIGTVGPFALGPGDFLTVTAGTANVVVVVVTGGIG